MGDPRKPRKIYSTPRDPWRADQLAQELFILGTYGLRNKRELWKAQTKLSTIRKQARKLLAASTDVRIREEEILLKSLKRIGIIGFEANVDDVLGLTVENLLERRLQTIVWRKGLSVSPYQSRQLISHRHIMNSDRILSVPSYLVSSEEEGQITLKPGSRFTPIKSEENQEAK